MPEPEPDCLTTSQMATLNTWNDEEIETLCENICSHLREPAFLEVNDSLKLLRRICGKSDCGCTKLTPYQNLSHLLRVQCTSDALTDYNVGLSIINNYYTLTHEKHCQTALQRLLRHSLIADPSDIRSHFLARLWPYPGLRDFSIDLLEEFLKSESKYLEEDVFNVFVEVLKNDLQPNCVWKSFRFERIVFWSCESARIFCEVTSVLNAWLIKIVATTEHYKSCVSVVSEFVNCVKLKCVENESDFVLLYPSEFHTLVSLLDIKPDLFPKNPTNKASISLATVVGLVKQSLDSRLVQTLCLLTHFPEWAPHITR